MRVRQVEQLDVAARRQVHDRAGRDLRGEAEGDRVAVLHLRHRVGVADEAHLDVTVGEAVHLEELARDLLAGVAALLGGDALALEVRDLVDAGIGQHDELEILRIERRDIADVVVRLVERRLAGHGVDRRDRVAEADIGLGLLDPAHIGDAGARQDLDRGAGDRLLPHVLELAAERNPGAALRPGHHPEVDRERRAGQREREAEAQPDGIHGGFHDVLSS